MDFASGQSLYIQKFDATENVAEVSEETLFQTCIVPLKLQVGENAIFGIMKSQTAHTFAAQYIFSSKKNLQLKPSTFIIIKYIFILLCHPTGWK